jgi:hypothetical protein
MGSESPPPGGEGEGEHFGAAISPSPGPLWGLIFPDQCRDARPRKRFHPFPPWRGKVGMGEEM